MGKKNASKIVTSNISSAAHPAASSATLTNNTSSILKSSFAPFHFHLPLFASVIQGLDSQHIRFHDTTTGRLQCEHAIGSRASVTCLDWGFYGQKADSTKKRKRLDALNGISSKGSPHDVVLAIGTSDSNVFLYSPIEAKVVAVLANAHTGGIRDFKFVVDGVNDHAWSLGGDAKLVQWDLRKAEVLKTLIAPSGSVNTLCPTATAILCASHLAFMIASDSESTVPSYNASTNAVHTILHNQFTPAKATQFLTIAKVDHSINIFTEDSPTLTGSLRTEDEILSASVWYASDQSARLDSAISSDNQKPCQALAALNKDGVMEIFPQPFDFKVSSSHEGQSLKARMKQRSRTSAAQIRIVNPDGEGAKLPLVGGAFEDDKIVLAWVERGVNIIFDRLSWRDGDTGDMLLKGVTNVMKAKSGSGLGAVVMNGVKDMGKSHVDDSRTVIGNGMDVEDSAMKDGPTQPETIEISSDEESADDEDGSQMLSPGPSGQADNVQSSARGLSGVDGVMMDARKPGRLETSTKEVEDATSDAPLEGIEEPTFGELLQAKGESTIDVPTTLDESNAHSLVPNKSTSLQTLPSGMSLSTVLTQSLRTNDTILLETCLHTKDLSVVRATIERLESHFAATLLQKLAERLHNRPGRAGRLMVWIQWTLVAHGGYLAGQPEAMRRLRSLHKVVRERASSLHHLLALKGKLDMLEAQMNLRKAMMEQGRQSNIAEEEDDEEGVIYVEGQEEEEEKEPEDEDEDDDDDDSSDDSSDSDSKAGPDADMDEELDDAMPTTTTNGILAEEDDDDDGEASDSDNALIDHEASSTDQDSDEGLSLDDDDINHDSVDTDSSDADDASAASSPPSKRPAPAQTKTRNSISARGR